MSHEALSGHTCNIPSFHAKLCQPPATSLGGDCLQVVLTLTLITYWSTLTLIYILVVGQFGLATGSGGITQSNVHTTSRLASSEMG